MIHMAELSPFDSIYAILADLFSELFQLAFCSLSHIGIFLFTEMLYVAVVHKDNEISRT